MSALAGSETSEQADCLVEGNSHREPAMPAPVGLLGSRGHFNFPSFLSSVLGPWPLALGVCVGARAGVLVNTLGRHFTRTKNKAASHRLGAQADQRSEGAV